MMITSLNYYVGKEGKGKDETLVAVTPPVGDNPITTSPLALFPTLRGVFFVIIGFLTCDFFRIGLLLKASIK